jgi:predicted enzyme related to lactoylglutathione lyase
MLNLNSILLFSENPEPLAEFYQKVFDTKPGWEQEGYTGFQVGSCMFMVGPHSEVHGKNSMPGRLILNFETDDVAKEFDRIKTLGAIVVKEPYQPGEESDMWLATFADPDGNYFQLASPMKM